MPDFLPYDDEVGNSGHGTGKGIGSMSITLTATIIKRGILVVLLAGLMFAAGFAARDADAQPSEGFVVCVNNYTGVMRMSDVDPGYFPVDVAEPREEAPLCQPHEEAWLVPLAFQIVDTPGRACALGGERASC